MTTIEILDTYNILKRELEEAGEEVKKTDDIWYKALKDPEFHETIRRGEKWKNPEWIACRNAKQRQDAAYRAFSAFSNKEW